VSAGVMTEFSAGGSSEGCTYRFSWWSGLAVRLRNGTNRVLHSKCMLISGEDYFVRDWDNRLGQGLIDWEGV
jgi:hypothetical protein